MKRHMQPLPRGTLALIFAAVALISTAGSASASALHIVQPGETAAPEPRNAGDVQSYTGRPGGTLFLLAAKHGVSLPISINGFSSGEWRKTGQDLPVPRAPAPQSEHPASALQPAPPVAKMQPGRNHPAVHIVQAGELLSDIAQGYGVNPAAMARLNNLQNDSTLEPGRALRIPSADALELLEGIERRLERARYPTRTERWVEVDLNEQMAIAYEGAAPVKAFVISSGVSDTPTVTGTFRIWSKVAVQDMQGGNPSAGTDYHRKDVRNVQYFYKNYAFHGAYWHGNFGTPMSRGCINMTDEDAQWLFDWASPSVHDDGDRRIYSTDANPGTLVLVHGRNPAHRPVPEPWPQWPGNRLSPAAQTP